MLLIVKQILLVSALGNIDETVWGTWILLLCVGCKGWNCNWSCIEFRNETLINWNKTDGKY